MNQNQNITEDQEHVLKGLKRYRYKKPQDSLEEVRMGMRRWCWEFLRLSKDYWLVCQTSKGLNIATQDSELRRLYLKFGDVHSSTFEEWWVNRGYRVFSEKEKFPKVKLIPSRPSERMSQHPTDETIWVEIPIKLSKRTIQKQIGILLNEYESIRPRRRMEISSAGFKFNSVQFGTTILKKVHEVYALHRELIEKPKWIKKNNPKDTKYVEKADLFRIGKLLKLSPSNEYGKVEELAQKHNRMRVAVSRNLKNARLLIKNLETGIFPSYETSKTTDKRFTAKQLEQHKLLEEKWWNLNLISELSIEKLKAVKAIHYEEPDHTRQNNLVIRNEERVVIVRDA